jgi:sugar fermentation stimulation protein A
MASFIEIDGKIVKGTFVDRPNRFLARVKLSKGVFPCFLPNPGRMHELLLPKVEVFVREALKENRKTRYDMIGVMHDGELVSVEH